ncbi:MAG: c-type cytochrome [Burkholderiales bacterium]|nr:c-type cytochrome [Burkholderiales bacterium]
MARSAKNSALALLMTWLTVTCAFAQDVQGRNWSGACTGCHGTEGRSEGAIPPIAGIDKARFVELMTAFRDGRKPGTIMHQHAKGLSDEQINALSEYFASRNPQQEAEQ